MTEYNLTQSVEIAQIYAELIKKETEFTIKKKDRCDHSDLAEDVLRTLQVYEERVPEEVKRMLDPTDTLKHRIEKECGRHLEAVASLL